MSVIYWALTMYFMPCILLGGFISTYEKLEYVLFCHVCSLAMQRCVHVSENQTWYSGNNWQSQQLGSYKVVRDTSICAFTLSSIE